MRRSPLCLTQSSIMGALPHDLNLVVIACCSGLYFVVIALTIATKCISSQFFRCNRQDCLQAVPRILMNNPQRWLQLVFVEHRMHQATPGSFKLFSTWTKYDIARRTSVPIYTVGHRCICVWLKFMYHLFPNLDGAFIYLHLHAALSPSQWLIQQFHIVHQFEHGMLCSVEDSRPPIQATRKK